MVRRPLITLTAALTLALTPLTGTAATAAATPTSIPTTAEVTAYFTNLTAACDTATAAYTKAVKTYKKTARTNRAKALTQWKTAKTRHATAVTACDTAWKNLSNTNRMKHIDDQYVILNTVTRNAMSIYSTALTDAATAYDRATAGGRAELTDTIGFAKTSTYLTKLKSYIPSIRDSRYLNLTDADKTIVSAYEAATATAQAALYAAQTAAYATYTDGYEPKYQQTLTNIALINQLWETTYNRITTPPAPKKP